MKLAPQEGMVLDAGRSLTPEQIINMDYLMENVVGAVPCYEELSELGKATVDMAGIWKASRDRRG